MTSQFRVLHIVQGMNMGGIETLLMNFYRNIDRSIIQFDFIVSCKEKSYYEDEIVSLGGKIYRMSSISIVCPYKYLNDVNIFLKNHQEYKIVHSHMNAVSALPLYIAKKNNVPVRICHSHTNQTVGFKGFLKIILKYPLRLFANNYFACSDEAANFLYGKWFFNTSNCYILKNAIDAPLYTYNLLIRSQIRKHYNINSEVVIGHVGRFVSVKNHKFILNAFKLIHDKNRNTILMLVGDGELRVEIIEKIKYLGLTESVIFTGSVQNVYDYLQAMDIYIFPSLYEGLGMSLIEAQASGLKCFAADTVPSESAVTNLVEFISLNKSLNIWRDKILDVGNEYTRKNMVSIIQDAGYDVKTSSEWLQNFYVLKNNEC